MSEVEEKVSNVEQGALEADDGVTQSSRKVDPSFKRNLMIIGGLVGGLVVAVVLMLLMRSKSSVASGGEVGLKVSSATQTTGEDSPLSPAMKAAIIEKQRQESAAAKARGEQVHMPAETLGSVTPIRDQEEQGLQQRQPMPHPSSGSGAYAEGVSQAEAEVWQRRREGLQRQLDGLVRSIEDQRPEKTERVVFTQPAQVQQAVGPSGQIGGTQFVGATVGQAGPAGTAGQSGVELVGGLEIAVGELASPVDTYKTNYTSARIVAGKLSGALLTGTVKVYEEGVQSHFTGMRFSGQYYQIDAIALDERTSTDALEARVDRRYLERFVFPVAMAAVGAYSQAKAERGSTVIVSQNGSIGIETPAPSSEQARNAGIGAGIRIIGQEAAKEAAKPLRFHLTEGTPVGILFRQPVLVKR